MLIIFAIIFALPFYWSILTSIRPNDQIITPTVSFFVHNPTIEHYVKVFTTIPFAEYIWNTSVITAMLMATNLVFCTLAGYAFAKLEFAGKNLVYKLMTLSMMLPAVVMIVPQFLVIARLPLFGGNNILGQGGKGLVGSFFGVVAPTAISVFNIFFMRQYYLSTPDDVADAARIDGANEFQVFFHIYVPMASPAVATLAVFCFQAGWNSFLWPVIVLQGSKTRVLTQGLQAFSFNNSMDYGPTMAASIMITIPILIVYIFAQKYFVQGIALSGIKE